jgi:RimJ/RimL family protein N-acetyltransferase
MRRAFLAAERTYLRPLERADAPRLLEFVAVPDVRRALRLGPADPASDAAFVGALVEPQDALLLAVAARDDDRLVGLCGLHRLGERAREAELGIFIGDPAEWGKGFGSEATRLLVGYGFRALDLDRVRLEVHADHARAIRAYERAGFRLDRTPPPVAAAPPPGFPDTPGFPGSDAAPLVSMSVLRSEWPLAAPLR